VEAVIVRPFSSAWHPALRVPAPLYILVTLLDKMKDFLPAEKLAAAFLGRPAEAPEGSGLAAEMLLERGSFLSFRLFGFLPSISAKKKTTDP